MPVRSRSILSRRTLLRTSAAAGGLLLGSPAIVTRAATRPAVPYGVQVGDVVGDRAIVWSRADRASRMRVRWSTTESMAEIGGAAERRRARGSRLRGQGRPRRPAGGAARVLRGQLPRPGRPQDHAASRCAAASSRRRPSRRNLRFVWSGDTVGQGWGINPDLGGMRIYETMRQVEPDFFIHSGDTIYADGPVYAEARTQDGKTWLGARRQALAQPHHPGEAEGGRDPARVPDELRLQPDGREPAPASTRRCRCMRSGTTTRSPTTGTGSCARTRTSATRRAASRFWPHGRCARSTTICRPGCTRWSRTGSTPASPTARRSRCSASTCAPIAARTAKACRPSSAPRRGSSASSSCPG